MGLSCQILWNYKVLIIKTGSRIDDEINRTNKYNNFICKKERILKEKGKIDYLENKAKLDPQLI